MSLSKPEGGAGGEESSSATSVVGIVVGGAALCVAAGALYLLYVGADWKTPSKAAKDSVDKILSQIAERLSPVKRQGTARQSPKRRKGDSDDNVSEEGVPLRLPSPIPAVLSSGEDARSSDFGSTEEDEVSWGGASWGSPTKPPIVTDEELIVILEDMTHEMEKALDAAMNGGDDVFYFYGTFMGCIMVLQTVYQEYGFAELPDLLAALGRRIPEVPEIAQKWEQLEHKLDLAGFEHMPFFTGHLTKAELVAVLENLLAAAREVFVKIQDIKTDETISGATMLADKFFEHPSRRNFVSFLKVASEEESAFVVSDILRWENDNEQGDSMNAVAVFEDVEATKGEWEQHYNLRHLIDTMEPLSDAQHEMMRAHGMGASLLNQEIAFWEKDDDIALLKVELNKAMARLKSN